ncbi:MAG TPA: RHS repeat-associated core domain-containing protein [Kofleriaceae bacterium]|nr:RHS repeat-associated core domain-containing protein [Kofleriaceae bacterium]
MGEQLAEVPKDLTVNEAVQAVRYLANAGPAEQANADLAARVLAALVYQGSRAQGARFDPDKLAEHLAESYLDGVGAWTTARLQLVMGMQLRAQKDAYAGGNGGDARNADVAKTDPVELFRGEFTHEATDLVVSGAGIDFAFHRTYRHQTVYDGPIGHRWDHGYNLSLQINDVSAYLWTGTGRAENYQRHGLWGQRGYYFYLPPDGVHATLEPIGLDPEAPTGWARRAPDGVRHIFMPEPGWSGTYRLARIEDRWGNYLAFTYQEGRLFECKVNRDDRRVRFSYDQLGRITRVEDFMRRAWRYVYDSHGDLVHVITPSTPSRKRGCVTEYRYSTSEHPTGPLAHNMTDIFDASGRHYLRNRYGTSVGMEDYNRVVHQRLAHGDFWFRYGAVDPVFSGELPVQDRPTMRVWVKERNGYQTLSIYNSWGGLLRKEETHTVNGGRGGERVVWRYRYNRDGQLIASRSPEGVVSHVLTAREHFYRVNNVDTNDPGAEDLLWNDPQLTADVRRSFGQVLATVNRARHRPGTEFDWNGRWGDVYQADADDIIVKHSYEPTFGQITTTSDPRTTTSPDPRTIEPPDYHRLLTRFEYANDATRGLLRVISPTPTLPDGTPGEPAIIEVLERDPRGRVTRARDAAGTERETDYYGAAEQTKEGFVRRSTVDRGDPTAGRLNITTEFEVDELGRVLATRLPRYVAGEDRFVTTAEYDDLDRTTVARGPTPLDFEIRTRHEPAGKPERVEVDWHDPRDQHGHSRGVLVRRYKYNEEHRIVREEWGGEDIGRHFRIAHKYDAAGTLRFTMAANDTAIHFRHDSRDQLVKTIRSYGVPDESIGTLTRDKDGRVVATTSGEGRRTTYEVDAFGRTVGIIDPLGNVTRRSYDKAGRPTVARHFERREDGRYWLLARTETIYDELGRPIRAVVNRFDEPLPAADITTDFEEAPGPGRRAETRTFYDAAGRVVAFLDPLGNRTSTDYDAIGRVVRVTDAAGNRIETTYDPHGNVVRKDRIDVVRDIGDDVVGQEVLTWTGTHDERDRLVSETDGLGNTTEHQYDSLDRRVLTKDPLGNISEVEYDVYGRLSSTVERRTDNGLGTGNPLEPAVVRYERDRSGNVLAQVDARGRRTEYRHDRSNRVIEKILPDGARVVTRYDRDNLAIAVRDAHGVVLRHEHDSAGRLRRTIADDAEVDANVVLEGARLLEHEYDGLARVTVTRNEAASVATRYDSLGSAVHEATVIHAAGGLAMTLERRFDDTGRLVGITYPGGRLIRHDRDALGRLRALTHESDGLGYPGARGRGARVLASFSYAGARLRGVARANGVWSHIGHDAAGRRVEVHHRAPSGTVLRVQQLFDAARNPRLLLDAAALPTEPAPVDARSDRFGYDAQYQLAARADAAGRPFQDLTPFAPSSVPQQPVPNRQALVDAAAGPYLPPGSTEAIDAWTYDLVGNRTQAHTGGTSHDYGEANARDQYQSIDGIARSYDAAGNLTADGRFAFRYDAWRRLCRVFDLGTGRNVLRCAYDSFGRRVIEDVDGAGALALLNDGVDRVADYRAGVCVGQYVHGDAIDDPVHLATGGADRWYHSDHQGSARALTDEAGAVVSSHRYDAFGALMESNGMPLGPTTTDGTAQPFGYGGRPFEPTTGLYDQRARAYDPGIGRFLQRDPAGPIDGTNLYSFAGNHPVAFGDPSGLGRSERASSHAYPGATSSPFYRRHPELYDLPASARFAPEAQESIESSPDAPPVRTVSAARDLVHRFNRVDASNPVVHGIRASDPGASVHPVEHVINEHGTTKLKSGPSQWISGSRRPGGASGMVGDPVYIDVELAKKAGVDFVDEKQLNTLAREYAEMHPERRAGIERWLTNQPNEREVVFRNDIPRNAVARPRARWWNGAAKWLGRVSKVETAYQLGKATYQSIEQGSPRPLAAQLVREGASYAGSAGGAAAGAAYGTRGGPIGVIVYGLWGGMVGGTLGYEAGDQLADEWIHAD